MKFWSLLGKQSIVANKTHHTLSLAQLSNNKALFVQQSEL